MTAVLSPMWIFTVFAAVVAVQSSLIANPESPLVLDRQTEDLLCPTAEEASILGRFRGNN